MSLLSLPISLGLIHISVIIKYSVQMKHLRSADHLSRIAQHQQNFASFWHALLVTGVKVTLSRILSSHRCCWCKQIETSLPYLKQFDFHANSHSLSIEILVLCCAHFADLALWGTLQFRRLFIDSWLIILLRMQLFSYRLVSRRNFIVFGYRFLDLLLSLNQLLWDGLIRIRNRLLLVSKLLQ